MAEGRSEKKGKKLLIVESKANVYRVAGSPKKKTFFRWFWNSIRSPGRQKNGQEKDVFTVIRKLNTVAGLPKKWTRKRRFYGDSETQHGRRVAKQMDKKKTMIRKLNTVAGSPKKWTRKRQRFYGDSETQHGCRVLPELALVDRWKYGQRERGLRRSLKVWPTWTGSEMRRSLKVWPTWTGCETTLSLQQLLRDFEDEPKFA